MGSAAAEAALDEAEVAVESLYSELTEPALVSDTQARRAAAHTARRPPSVPSARRRSRRAPRRASRDADQPLTDVQFAAFMAASSAQAARDIADPTCPASLEQLSDAELRALVARVADTAGLHAPLPGVTRVHLRLPLGDPSQLTEGALGHLTAQLEGRCVMRPASIKRLAWCAWHGSCVACMAWTLERHARAKRLPLRCLA